jgi:hypothetical protein
LERGEQHSAMIVRTDIFIYQWFFVLLLGIVAAHKPCLLFMLQDCLGQASLVEGDLLQCSLALHCYGRK